jgi:transcriptional regulator with XRE-family HTH domain
MQSLHLENIALLLSLQTVHIKVPRIPYPPHWKAGQRLSTSPQSLGDQIRKHRLKLHWLQADLAKAIGAHAVSVSNWERGTSTPSRRMTKRIQEFFEYAPKPVPKSTQAGLCLWKCEMHETNGQLCLFKKLCKQINYSGLRPQLCPAERGERTPLAHYRHDGRPTCPSARTVLLPHCRGCCFHRVDTQPDPRYATSNWQRPSGWCRRDNHESTRDGPQKARWMRAGATIEDNGATPSAHLNAAA